MLLLSPFSLLSTVTQVLIALVVAFFSLLIYKQRNLPYSIYKGIKIRTLFMGMALIFIWGLLGSMLSIVELSSTKEVQLSKILERGGVQQFAVMVSFIQVICGYYMATLFSDRGMRKAIVLPFILVASVGAYQLLAIKYGFPYIGNFVDDKFIGLRPTSLAKEPKYLSSYLACMFFYLGFLLVDTRFVYFKRVWVLMGLLVSLSFFIQAGSANGFITILALAILLLFVLGAHWRLRTFTILTITILVAYYLLATLDLEAMNLRGSHKDILGNISNLNLSLFDDLIALPTLAWIENPLKMLLGFGPGLMHFFAYRFINQATWLTDETYIEGNVAFLMYASNLGLLLYGLLLLLIGWFAVSLVRRPPQGISRSTAFFFAAAFIAGAVVSGAQSVPLFISIGWILGRRYSVNSGRSSA